MPRRRADDEDDPWESWEPGVGSIGQLTEKEPPGFPFEPKRGPIGFCIDPMEYKQFGGTLGTPPSPRAGKKRTKRRRITRRTQS